MPPSVVVAAASGCSYRRVPLPAGSASGCVDRPEAAPRPPGSIRCRCLSRWHEGGAAGPFQVRRFGLEWLAW